MAAAEGRIPHEPSVASRHASLRHDEEVDIAIVGCGAGGGVLAQRLARQGWRVVVFDAGPFWDPDRDWVSDEAGSHQLYWNEPRVISGLDPVELGSNNSGRGVGGLHGAFRGLCAPLPSVRLPHPHERRRRGRLADRATATLKRYYELAGGRTARGRPALALGGPAPLSALARIRWAATGKPSQRAALAAGIDVRVGPVAIANGRFGNRSHCIYRGFCLQGCKVNAKASPLITHVPDALAHGAEIRPDCMVSRVEIDEHRRATGIAYFHEGREYRQRARLVAVAGYSIETPRLLLNSACPQFPEGLCNDFDQVGRYVMVQGAPQTTGRYEEEIRSYKAPPPECSSEAFYETDPTKSYKRGFSLQCISPLPIVFAEHVCAQGHWGETLPRIHA